jgi:regulator of protease activity HflC (stomatin/prohibitin superfamily)
MNELEKNLAVARGEAMAAHLIASAALQAALMVLPNRLEVLGRISTFIDDTLNISGPAKGDAHDELNTQMREVARFQTTQTLQQIEHMLRNPPAKE